MINFIKLDDYKYKLRTARLQQIIEQDEEVLQDAEITAIAMVSDALHAYYDTDVIFSKVNENRDFNVVRWVVNLTVYYIYERVPDKLTPKRVVKNYDDTMDLLFEIADGKKSVMLPKKTNEEDQPLTKFRWNSQPPRSH